ncbi:unnamed protein product [Rhodiola kirilowii]
MADQKLPYNTLIHMLNIKLSASNFILWKTQVTHILRAQKLFGFLDGSSPCPPAPVQPPAPTDPAAKAHYDASLLAFEDWVAEDQRLCGLLFSSLTEEAMAEVIGCSTSQQIWETLFSVYQNRSRSSVLQLRDQVLNLRRTGKVHELHLQFKAIFDRLASMGAAATNDDQVLWFLRALGYEYKEFSAPLLNLSPSPTYVDVVAQAENHEAFLTSLSGHSSSGAASLPAVSSVAFTASDQPLSDVHSRSWQPNHRSAGHPARTGRPGPRRDSRGQGRGRRDAPQCQWCGKVGHIASSCFRLVSPSRRSVSAHLADSFQSSLQLEPSSRSSDWYVDSGATNHMASSSSSLENVAPYTEQGFQGGRGQRPR